MIQMTLLKDFWKGPNFKERAIETQIANAAAKLLGAPQMADFAGTKVKGGQIAAAKQARANALMAIELIALLPHSIQATLESDDAAVWCTLSEDSLINSASDITLIEQHGNVWRLDCRGNS